MRQVRCSVQRGGVHLLQGFNSWQSGTGNACAAARASTASIVPDVCSDLEHPNK